MPVPLKLSEKEVECPDRIEGWLEKLEVKGSETDESEGDGSTQSEIWSLGPTTPTRKPPRSTLDEVSPTDTSFSGQSIFDVRLHKTSFGSPTPKCEIRDDDSDTTSIDTHDWAPALSGKPTLERLVPPNFAPRSSAASISFDSHNSATDVSSAELTAIPKPNAKHTLPTQDPNEPRPVWIASCLQCTLAGLPCSRTYPYSSRCTRNNRAKDCLLQRRCFISEVLDSSLTERYKAPALLKVKGEDEEIWQRKLALAEELQAKCIVQQDEKNWVLPAIDSPRGGWSARRNKAKEENMSHPGEGIGRLSFCELIVEVDA